MKEIAPELVPLRDLLLRVKKEYRPIVWGLQVNGMYIGGDSELAPLYRYLTGEELPHFYTTGAEVLHYQERLL